MKKYLDDLKTALKKLEFSEKEIQDILADHEEMINEAIAAGLDVNEIAKKFGAPEKVAADIAELCEREPVEKNAPEGYSEANSFDLSGITDIDIKLVSEDIVCEGDGGSKLRVYYKGDIALDRYEIGLKNGQFYLRRKNMDMNAAWFRRNEMAFIVRIPANNSLGKLNHTSTSSDFVYQNMKLDSFTANSTSGDAFIDHLSCTNSFKLASVSGDIHLTKIVAATLLLSEVSGDVLMEESQFKGNIDINSVSGDVKVVHSESKNASFRTVSGDLLGEEFYPESVELKSVSGDLTLQNTDHLRVVHIKSAHSVSGDIRIR